jgi:hypothetical protein
MAAKSVQAVHMNRKFSPSQAEHTTPSNQLYQKFVAMGLSAHMATDYLNRVHPPKFRNGKFGSLPNKTKPLLSAVTLRKGNAIRGIPGGVKRNMAAPAVTVGKAQNYTNGGVKRRG